MLGILLSKLHWASYRLWQANRNPITRRLYFAAAKLRLLDSAYRKGED